MAVRLRLRISADSRFAEEVALLNSSYETPSPQLIIPVATAKQLRLWPPEDAIEAKFDTAGGAGNSS